jgi:hypothetical protein
MGRLHLGRPLLLVHRRAGRILRMKNFFSFECSGDCVMVFATRNAPDASLCHGACGSRICLSLAFATF